MVAKDMKYSSNHAACITLWKKIDLKNTNNSIVRATKATSRNQGLVEIKHLEKLYARNVFQ